MDYTYTLDTLDRYDYQQLIVEETTPEAKFQATYENAMAAIRNLKKKSVKAVGSGTKKMILSKVLSVRFIKPLMVKKTIHPLMKSCHATLLGYKKTFVQ